MISTLLYIIYKLFFYKDAINDCLHNKKKLTLEIFIEFNIIYNNIAL